jgi:hypothetical protein
MTWSAWQKPPFRTAQLNVRAGEEKLRIRASGWWRTLNSEFIGDVYPDFFKYRQQPATPNADEAFMLFAIIDSVIA